MSSFSERIGIKPMNTIVLKDSINDGIRNGLWSIFFTFIWNSPRGKNCLFPLWMNYFKFPVDTIPESNGEAYEFLRNYYFKCKWNEVYDFIEFIANEFDGKQGSNENLAFMNACNYILERELSAYRFIDGIIVPLTSEEEIAEIDEALEKSKLIGSVSDHLKRAIELFADKKKPDYRNSIKESISAVEAICNLIIGSNHSTLNDALKKIEAQGKVAIRPTLRSAFDKLYAYTSTSEEGIRHALLNEPTLDFEDAKFMLISCSAFTNYLIAKSSNAGIELKKEK